MYINVLCVICTFFPWSFMKANHNISASRSPTWQRDSFVVRILGMYEWNFAKGEAPQTLWLSLVYHRCFLVFSLCFSEETDTLGILPSRPRFVSLGVHTCWIVAWEDGTMVAPTNRKWLINPVVNGLSLL